MESMGESVQTGWLTESRKDLIAGGLFLLLVGGALLFFTLNRLPVDVPMHTILKDFTRDLFLFKPQ